MRMLGVRVRSIMPGLAFANLSRKSSMASTFSVAFMRLSSCSMLSLSLFCAMSVSTSRGVITLAACAWRSISARTRLTVSGVPVLAGRSPGATGSSSCGGMPSSPLLCMSCSGAAAPCSMMASRPPAPGGTDRLLKGRLSACIWGRGFMCRFLGSSLPLGYINTDSAAMEDSRGLMVRRPWVGGRPAARGSADIAPPACCVGGSGCWMSAECAALSMSSAVFCTGGMRAPMSYMGCCCTWRRMTAAGGGRSSAMSSMEGGGSAWGCMG
mmetsp:Transcript_4666/g.10110  ORF Transcript_4666/g.10110 Transcript_4666/m.10110 type:complete len:268 (-) Transcript_4666:358-1161(-)